MLQFLSSLSKPTGGETGVLDSALIEAATERALDGAAPCLRTFFVSAEHLQDGPGGFKTVRDYLLHRGGSGTLPDAVASVQPLLRFEGHTATPGAGHRNLWPAN